MNTKIPESDNPTPWKFNREKGIFIDAYGQTVDLEKNAHFVSFTGHAFDFIYESIRYIDNNIHLMHVGDIKEETKGIIDYLNKIVEETSDLTKEVAKSFVSDSRYLIHHHQIDDLIKTYFDLDEYRSSYIENWDKGDHIYIELDKNRKYKDVIPYITSIRNKEKVSGITEDILQYLCNKDVIPSGKYIISVFW